MPLIECFDVGGTSIRGAIIENENILVKKTIPSVSGNFSALISVIQQLSHEIRGLAKKETVDGTIIGLPGPIRGNVLLNSGPLGITSSVSLGPLLQAFPNLVKIENDLKLAVHAEFFRGQGNGLDSFYLLAISTGMGTGLVWNKKIVSGTMGEFGHVVLDAKPAAIPCVLPHRGCWFAYSSGKGIEMQSSHSSKDVFLLAKNGDEKSKKIIAAARAANAHGIGNMLNVFAVQKIIIMGSLGLSQFEEIIPTEQEIQPFTLHPIPPIVPSLLGDDVGLWGAYYFGVEAKKE